MHLGGNFPLFAFRIVAHISKFIIYLHGLLISVSTEISVLHVDKARIMLVQARGYAASGGAIDTFSAKYI